MQVNKFVTMTVGLIVGVLLVAGLMVPVIANVSSNGGGAHEVYNLNQIFSEKGVTLPEKYHSYDFYINGDHNVDTVLTLDDVLALMDIPISANSDVYVPIFSVYFPPYEDWMGLDIYYLPSMGVVFDINGGAMVEATMGDIKDWSEFTFNFATGEIHVVDAGNVVWDAVARYAYLLSESEDGVICIGNDNYPDLDPFTDLDIYVGEGVRYYGMFYTLIGQTGGGSRGYSYDFSYSDATYGDESLFLQNITLASEYEGYPPCTFDITIPCEGGICSSSPVVTYEIVDIPDGYAMQPPVDCYIDAVSVMGYSGDGADTESGPSPVLTTMLSVIPLVTVVGLIIGALAFLRMKN